MSRLRALVKKLNARRWHARRRKPLKQLPDFLRVGKKIILLIWGTGYGEINYKNDPEFIVIHHSGTFRGDAKVFDRFHRRNNHWRCIGYHYVILRYGGIEKGRFERMNGSHCPGLNRRSIGVCCVGNFEYDPPMPRQIGDAAKLCANLCWRYQIPTENIIDHREGLERFWNPYHPNKQKKTDCPGLWMDLRMNMLRELTQKYLDKGTIIEMEVV